MLSDEEKKALKEVKHFNQLTRYWQEEEYEEKEIAGYIATVLNLIEKQSKEIEELKNTETYKLAIIDKYKYISKDKIKAKMEELEKLDFGTDLVSQFTANLTTITILQSLLEKE